MITREMAKEGCDVSEYLVRQMLKQMGYRHRSFIKDLPMKDVKDRNAQFLNIADIREKASAIGLPIISIDTKKKLIRNFKRDGKVLTLGQLVNGMNGLEACKQFRVTVECIQMVIGYLDIFVFDEFVLTLRPVVDGCDCVLQGDSGSVVPDEIYRGQHFKCQGGFKSGD